MEIVNHRRKMLYAMENNAEGNEKCRREMQKGKATIKKKKKIEEVRRKTQTYLLHSPSYYLERLA